MHQIEQDSLEIEHIFSKKNNSNIIDYSPKFILLCLQGKCVCKLCLHPVHPPAYAPAQHVANIACAALETVLRWLVAVSII